MKKVVFIDWFGVISNKCFLEWAKENAPEETVLEILSLLADQVDIGEITLAQFRQEVGRLTGKTADEVRQGIKDKIQINQAIVDFIRKIKADYLTVVLSNASGEFIREVIQEKNLADLFDHVIASSDLEVVKPNPEIFRKAIEIIGGCDKAVLIDDTPGNVESFKKHTGQHGIVYTGSVTQLECDFQAIRNLGF